MSLKISNDVRRLVVSVLMAVEKKCVDVVDITKVELIVFDRANDNVEIAEIFFKVIFCEKELEFRIKNFEGVFKMILNINAMTVDLCEVIIDAFKFLSQLVKDIKNFFIVFGQFKNTKKSPKKFELIIIRTADKDFGYRSSRSGRINKQEFTN